MGLQPKPPTIIADVRLCVNYPANSSTAVHAAVADYGLKHVLLDCVFSRPEENGEPPNFFFCPKIAADYSALETMSIGQWYDDEDRRRSFPEIDSLPEIQIVKGIESIWIYFDFAPKFYAQAMEVLWTSSFKDSRFVVVAPEPLPPFPHVKRVDPTGKADLILTTGGIFSLFLNRKEKAKTFAFGSTSNAAFRTTTVI